MTLTMIADGCAAQGQIEPAAELYERSSKALESLNSSQAFYAWAGLAFLAQERGNRGAVPAILNRLQRPQLLGRSLHRDRIVVALQAWLAASNGDWRDLYELAQQLEIPSNLERCTDPRVADTLRLAVRAARRNGHPKCAEPFARLAASIYQRLGLRNAAKMLIT